MFDTAIFLLINFLPAVITTLVATYLYRIVTSPARLKSIMKKYSPDTPIHEMRRKMYTMRFVIVWIILAGLSILHAGVSVYRLYAQPSLIFMLAVLVISAGALLAAGHLQAGLFDKRGGAK